MTKRSLDGHHLLRCSPKSCINLERLSRFSVFRNPFVKLSFINLVIIESKFDLCLNILYKTKDKLREM